MTSSNPHQMSPAGATLQPATRRGEPEATRPVKRQPSQKWEAFGQAVLAFHRRVGATAMCQCGRTVIECDILAQARYHGLINE